MPTELRTIAETLNLPFIGSFGEMNLEPENYEESKIFRLIGKFGGRYGGELVLYGGQTATEKIFGLKKIRAITTDLDFACSREGILAAAAGERPFYHPGFDILFSVCENVPISFALGHIHDWQIDAGFFDTAVAVMAFEHVIRCSSREYSIMLKLRRAADRMRHGLPPFGKDALDIINIVSAPCSRADLRPVDAEALAAIVRLHVTGEAALLSGLEAFIRRYTDHLTDSEAVFFSGQFLRITRALASA